MKSYIGPWQIVGLFLLEFIHSQWMNLCGHQLKNYNQELNQKI